MSGYSESTDSQFANVRLRSLRALIQLVRDSAIRDVQYVRRRFVEVAPHFETTVQFLSALGCIVTRDGALALQGRLATNSGSDEELSQGLLTLLGNGLGPTRRELFRFLDKFQIVGGHIVYRPLADQRSVESDLRNLLLEMAVIAHDPVRDEYLLDPKHGPLLMNAVRGRRIVSPQTIEDARAESTALGEAIERVVVRFEQLRLGDQYAQHVEHIAVIDASAGYDVESVTVEPHQTLIPRLIEVKAVPPGTLRFYWTANEIATARRFGSWYFLYLVPMRSDGHPDLGALHIIQNPYGAVMAAKATWTVTPELFRCELSQAASHGRDLHTGEAPYA